MRRVAPYNYPKHGVGRCWGGSRLPIHIVEQALNVKRHRRVVHDKQCERDRILQVVDDVVNRVEDNTLFGGAWA